MAAALDVNNGTIQSARVGVTGASSHATRLTDVEEALAGQPLSMRSIEAAARLAGANLEDVNSDIHASQEYRRAMIPVFTERALGARAGASSLQCLLGLQSSGLSRTCPCSSLHSDRCRRRALPAGRHAGLVNSRLQAGC